MLEVVWWGRNESLELMQVRQEKGKLRFKLMKER
jgi:hypothetical protein